jgi:hypothetical protein
MTVRFHVGNCWARFRHMRRRVEDDTRTVENVELSIANAQDKGHADAAAAALRPLYRATFHVHDVM